MPFGLFNALMLLGLIAVVVPPIIHLLTRKRFDVVEWAAMQFLQVSDRTRRKLFIEELLLMALRMALIAIMVLVLAAPFVTSRQLAKWGGRANRDVVLVFDGSSSMDLRTGGPTAHENAKEWSRTFLEHLAPGDHVAILQAKQQVVPVVERLSADLDQVRTGIQNLSPPRGGCDWPGALRAAWQILTESQRAQREIVILTDNQRFGWADDASLMRWELLTPPATTTRHRIWVVNVAADRPANPSNWSLSPIRSSRAIAAVGREVTFRTALIQRGADGTPPPVPVMLEIDGRHAGGLTVSGKLENGQIPLTFRHRFTSPGSHLVTVRAADDSLPGDNRQDLAVEVVPALPVLIIDGDDRPSARARGSDYLRDALAPARDPNPSVLVRVVPISGFEPALLTRDLGEAPGTSPRVLVLSNVARLTPAQQEAVERFMGDNGGVLIALGDRCDPTVYNDQYFRNGRGWFPARLVEPVGVESDLNRAARPVPASFFHPTVELFRESGIGGLADARFPRRWRVSLTGATQSIATAMLTGSEPLLVERPFRNGRVMLCTHPLDNSWRTNLHELPAFVPFAHELVNYLAGGRASERNLLPGQPIRHQPTDDSPPGPITVHLPSDAKLELTAKSWPFSFEDTREPGVYRLTSPGDRNAYYVVQPDARESDLAGSSDVDQNKVVDLVPGLRYMNDGQEVVDAISGAAPTKELWLPVLLGVMLLLIFEILMTRRMVKHRT